METPEKSKSLPYWKSRLTDLRAIIRQLRSAETFAAWNVQQLEREKLSVKNWIILIAAATLCLM